MEGRGMSAYERGFLTKCAEYGLDERSALELMEKRSGFIGGALGLAALLGLGAYGVRSAMDKWDRDPVNRNYRSRRESLDAINRELGAAAASKGVTINDEGDPGTLLGRTWDRLTLGRSEFDSKYHKYAKKLIEDAVSAKEKADSTSAGLRGMAPEPVTTKANDTGKVEMDDTSRKVYSTFGRRYPWE